MANRTVESATISDITNREKMLTGQDDPVKGGPTAQAQRHVHDKISSGSVVSDIAKGEEAITQNGAPVAGGPAAAAQSQAAQARNEARDNPDNPQKHTGTLDGQTISEINAAESKLTGQAAPVKGGPTAQAQKHANEPITADALHDITEGEKKVAGDRVKGGPTAAAQSELAKARRS
ncbi:hypothetical protein DHEL01_v208585 [Diaporthe helianthi]|uniref:SMP domain-containing protein n=1 Tax=Diaporthe helianthi TaxID=158607 RepID=A0A2P5HRZ2_DIAHE|nr:hypothetical protein DHEL01_v208585 [Diaporthe helianthi]